MLKRDPQTLLVLCLIGLLFSVEQGYAKARLCFFSLNNQTEVTAVREIVNLDESTQVEVKEYVAYGDIAEEAFQKMAASGEHCDGLVISGHHRLKGFEGSRVPGYFPTTSLEKISCSPGLEDWFSRVRAVWLQGCATGEREGEDATGIAKKFRHLFPQAMVFSWSGSAPSRLAPVTIPYQLENFARLDGIRDANKTKALRRILSGSADNAAMEAWKMLRISKHDGFQGISKPSAQAYPPLSQEVLAGGLSAKNARRCSLVRDSKRVDRQGAIQEILVSPHSISENIELLEQEVLTAQNYPEYSQNLSQTIHKSLSENISPILANRSVPLWKKIATYRIYLNTGGQPNPRLKNSLVNEFRNFSEKKSARGRDAVELKTIYDRVFLQSFKKIPANGHWLPLGSFINIPSNDALRSILRALIAEKPVEQAQVLEAIAKNPYADTETLHHLALQARAISVWNLAKISEKIRGSGRAAAKTLALLQ